MLMPGGRKLVRSIARLPSNIGGSAVGVINVANSGLTFFRQNVVADVRARVRLPPSEPCVGQPACWLLHSVVPLPVEQTR